MAIQKPLDFQHSYSEARMFLPEEQKAFAIKMMGLIDQYQQALEQAQSTEDVTETRLKLNQLLVHLAEPVKSHVLVDVNHSLDEKNLDPMTPEDVQDIYGVPNLTDFTNLINEQVPVTFRDWAFNALYEMQAISASLQKVIDDRGGDSNVRLAEVVSQYEIDEDSSWHRHYFDSVETYYHTLALNILTKRFGIPSSQLVTEDLGCGSGRTLHQLVEIFGKGFVQSPDHSPFTDVQTFPVHGSTEIAEFTKHYHGVDISEKNVEKTLKLTSGIMKGHDLDAPPVTVGNFHDVEGGPKPGTIHYAFSMMRTSFHNITEAELVSFLRRIERDLVPGTEERHGGMVLLDFVDMRRIDPESREGVEVESSLDDLKNLYTQLFRAYAERYQALMPPHIQLRDMPRYPIYDNTTGKGFYWREVISKQYVMHLMEKHNLDLRVKMDTSVRNPKYREIQKNPSERARAINLGRRWIKENELEDYYIQQISGRLSRGVIRSDLLERTGYARNNDIEAILDYVAYHMVKGFRGSYLMLDRPRKLAG